MALKNGLIYENVKDKLDSNGNQISKEMVIINDLRESLEGLLTKDLNKALKLGILDSRVLGDQYVLRLEYAELQYILRFIDKNILPYINDKNTAGQDLLNLFLLPSINS